MLKKTRTNNGLLLLKYFCLFKKDILVATENKDLYKTRPAQHLADLMKAYPMLSEHVELFVRDRGKDLPDWPKWCFMPMAAWYALESISYQDPSQIAKLAAIGTWRYSQGIYCIDESLANALAMSEINGNLPCAGLFRLPEWCIYIKTPKSYALDKKVHGFFAHLEHDVNSGRPELRLLLDTDIELIPIPIHLGEWPLSVALLRAENEAKRNRNAFAKDADFEDFDIEVITSEITPLISFLLYLCTEQPDTDIRLPQLTGTRPAYKKIKGQWRLFPAQKPRLFTVGRKIGQKLRQAETEITAAKMASGERSPHLRRAHWHGYWKGPLSGSRTFFYKWLNPIFVE
jgi:hypothetical protein